MDQRNQCHREVLEAFKRIDLKGMLSWALLDQKPEKYITVALAAALNAGGRKALTEHSRLDLVLIEKWTQDRNYQLRAGYEAKCEHLARFAGAAKRRRASKTADWYNGCSLAADLQRMEKWQNCSVRGGLFYLVDMSPADQHSKFGPRYSGNNPTADEAIARIEDCVKMKRFEVANSAEAFVSTGNGSPVRLQLHMVLFDADSPSQT
jgi:hypothetical protein